MTSPGLLIPSREERTACDQAMTVSASDLPPASFPGWEEVAKQYAEKLLASLKVELQRQNDCQAFALTTGEEARQFLHGGRMTQMASTYAYNACEWIGGKAARIGRDQGTTIQSGVTLLTKGITDLGVAPGLPAESTYPYGSYERNSQRFIERAKGAVIIPSSVTDHGLAPTAEQLPLVCAVGGSVHAGVFWAPQFVKRRLAGREWKVWNSTPSNGGGHALTFGIFVVWIPEENCFWPCIWNSHGDGPILIPPELWDRYAKRQFEPFGGYVLLPDKPAEKWHDRLQSGGGYV